MNVNEIMKFLPHRYPFLLVDRVEEIEADKRIVAYKNITFNEDVFNGHFPGARMQFLPNTVLPATPA